MNRTLLRRLDRLASRLDVPALSAEMALRLCEAGVVDLDQLSDAQLEAIADGRVR